MSASASSVIQPLQGWPLGGITQGRRWCANPGLSDHNPFGVGEGAGSLPKVKPQKDYAH